MGLCRLLSNCEKNMIFIKKKLEVSSNLENESIEFGEVEHKTILKENVFKEKRRRLKIFQHNIVAAAI